MNSREEHYKRARLHCYRAGCEAGWQRRCKQQARDRKRSEIGGWPLSRNIDLSSDVPANIEWERVAVAPWESKCAYSFSLTLSLIRREGAKSILHAHVLPKSRRACMLFGFLSFFFFYPLCGCVYGCAANSFSIFYVLFVVVEEEEEVNCRAIDVFFFI